MDRYDEIMKESEAMNEFNDCAIIALSLFLDKPYKEIHDCVSNLGRKEKKGTPFFVTLKTVQEFGKKYGIYYRCDTAYNDFKKAAKIKGKYILTRHLDGSFAEEFVKIFGKRVMVRVRGHIAAVVDGVLQDWSIKRSLRIENIIVLRG